jgi:hypothetical protein
MVSKEEIEKRKRIERHIQNKIDYLKSTMNGYKGAIDICSVAELSSYSWIVATQTKDLKEVSANLNKGQEEQFANLQKEYVQQFDRLRHGHCECKPRVKEQMVMEHE